MTELVIHEAAERNLGRALEDGTQLSYIACAIGQTVGWEGFTQKVTSEIAVLAPGDETEDARFSDQRTSDLCTAAKIGDKPALVALAAEAYITRRVEDGSVLEVNEAADQIVKFAKRLASSNVTKTQAGATSLLVKGLEGLQQREGRLTPAVYNYTNGMLHALRTKQTEARLSLGAKSALAIGAVAGLTTLKQAIKR